MVSIGHETNNPYARYGLEHFLFKYGIKAAINQEDSPDVEIYYGNSGKSNGRVSIRVLPGEIQPEIMGYLEAGSDKLPLFETPVKLNAGDKDRAVATFYNDGETCAAALVNDKELSIGFNIFGEIGHMLAGNSDPLFARREIESKNLMTTPVVDVLEDFLFESLQLICQKNGIVLGTKPFWPEGKEFALCLTHDVDRVSKTYQYVPSMLKFLKRGDIHGLAGQVKSLITKHGISNPYWCFDKIVHLEKDLGVKSTFYFLNESGRFNPFNPKSYILYGGRYRIDSRDMMNIIKSLYNDGFDIGVHGSYRSYKNIELLAREKARLEEIISDKVYGIRQHYLNFDSTNTHKIHKSLGFEHDSTLGFRPQEGIGFRRGTSFPFRPFNPDTGESFPQIEIPLIIMEGALLRENAMTDCITMMDKVSRHHGVLTILWHQRMFNEEEFPKMTDLYRHLVESGQRKNAWVTNAREIYKWVVNER
jgi:hypothetical protein